LLFACRRTSTPAFDFDTHPVVLKDPSDIPNPDFPDYTPVVLFPFIFYNASKIARVGA